MRTAEDDVSVSPAQFAVRCFSLGLFLAAVLVLLLPKLWLGRNAIQDEDATNERIRPIAGLDLRPPSELALKGQRTGTAIVQEFCQSCHGQGLQGAPKVGDRKAWAPRLDQGLNLLVQAVASGKRCKLPPGASDADDRELARAIVHLVWPRMRL